MEVRYNRVLCFKIEVNDSVFGCYFGAGSLALNGVAGFTVLVGKSLSEEEGAKDSKELHSLIYQRVLESRLKP